MSDLDPSLGLLPAFDSFGAGASLSEFERRQSEELRSSLIRPDPHTAWRHQDGGIYEVLMIGKDTTESAEHVVYKHLWPFEEKVWLRPLAEWTRERFDPIPWDTVYHIKSSTKSVTAAAQVEISARRKERKAIEARAVMALGAR